MRKAPRSTPGSRPPKRQKPNRSLDLLLIRSASPGGSQANRPDQEGECAHRCSNGFSQTSTTHLERTPQRIHRPPFAKMMRDSKAESAHTREVLEPSGERPQQREQGHGKRSTKKQSRSEKTQAAEEGNARFGSAERESDQGSTASVRNGEETLGLAGPHKTASGRLGPPGHQEGQSKLPRVSLVFCASAGSVNSVVRCPFVHQKLTHRRVFAQADCAIACGLCFRHALHAREQMRRQRPVRLIAHDSLRRNRFE